MMVLISIVKQNKLLIPWLHKFPIPNPDFLNYYHKYMHILVCLLFVIFTKLYSMYYIFLFKQVKMQNSGKVIWEDMC